MKHYLHPALLAADGHQVSVDLIGAGGTGSALLTHLARIHLSLQARGHQGLCVRVFDPDHVEEANLVRQHFTVHDLHRNKAEVAVERLNRFYGLNWQAMPVRWNENWVKHPIGHFPFANLTITCVDTVKARRTLLEQVREAHPRWNKWFSEDGSVMPGSARNVAHFPLYWLDVGNARDIGQVVLGTFGPLPQPYSYGQGELWSNLLQQPPPLRRFHPGDRPEHVIADNWNGYLPTIFDKVPNLEEEEDTDQTPSCSLLQALTKQSIMVNPLMATAAANLIAQMFEQKQLTHHGCYVNLKTLTMSAMPVPKLQAA